MVDWWIDESPPVGPYTRPSLWDAPDSDPMGDLQAAMRAMATAYNTSVDNISVTFRGMRVLMTAVVDEVNLELPPQSHDMYDRGKINNTGPRPSRAFGRGGRKRY